MTQIQTMVYASICSSMALAMLLFFPSRPGGHSGVCFLRWDCYWLLSHWPLYGLRCCVVKLYNAPCNSSMRSGNANERNVSTPSKPNVLESLVTCTTTWDRD